MAATIRDVARLAGVSTSTVSRALNAPSCVKHQTLSRIMKAVQECHYVPNTFARNLKTNSSKTIGLLISDISNSHFTSMAKAIETILRENGFSMIVCSTDENPQQELDYLHHMLSSQVDGLILNTTNFNNDQIVEFSSRLPVVLIERNIEEPGFRGDYIGSNNQEGMKEMTQYLLRNGHRKIGLINCETQVSTGRERLQGFVNAMRAAGISAGTDYPYLFDCASFSVENGYTGCAHLMTMEDRPTALLVTNNTLTIGVLKYLRSHQVSVPKDISVMSYGNIEHSDLFCVDLGHAALSPAQIGEKAAGGILSRIEKPNLRNREVIFEPVLMTGQSVCSTKG